MFKPARTRQNDAILDRTRACHVRSPTQIEWDSKTAPISLVLYQLDLGAGWDIGSSWELPSLNHYCSYRLQYGSPCYRKMLLNNNNNNNSETIVLHGI